MRRLTATDINERSQRDAKVLITEQGRQHRGLLWDPACQYGFCPSTTIAWASPCLAVMVFYRRTSIVRDVELQTDGALSSGTVFTSDHRPVENAQIELRFQGTTIARTTTGLKETS